MDVILILIGIGFGVFMLVSLVRLIIWSIRLVKSRAMLNSQEYCEQDQLLRKLDEIISLLKLRDNS